MMQREQWKPPAPSPSWRAFVTAQGLPFWACTTSGAFSALAPPAVQAVRGGIFADEPGAPCCVEA